MPLIKTNLSGCVGTCVSISHVLVLSLQRFLTAILYQQVSFD